MNKEDIDVTLSKTAELLQQERTFVLAAKTQPARGHHHTHFMQKETCSGFN